MSKGFMYERQARLLGSDAGADVPTPGKATLTQSLVAEPRSDSARDRARSLIEQLRARATRLDVAIQERDFDAADSAACVIDRMCVALDRELEQADDPALSSEAEATRAKLDELMPRAPEPRVPFDGDRKRRHAEWHTRIGGTSAPGIPDSLRTKLERTLGGGNLSGVRIHTDAAAQASAAAHDARAYTIGQDIYFGAGQFDPDNAQGQHLIAHEVAHTVQQRGGGEANGAGEAEAERFAQAVALGGTATISESVAPSVQCFGALDFVKVVAGPVGLVLDKTGAIDALEDAIKSGSAEALRLAISTGGDLLAVLTRIGERLARELIQLLADGTMGVLAHAVKETLDSEVIELIFDALGSEQVQSLIRVLVAISGFAAVRKILRVLYDSEALQYIGEVLFTLPFAQVHTILRHVGAPVLKALWNKFRAKLLDWIISLLDDCWKIDYGVLLGGSASATFGYPIRLGGDYEANVSRLDRTNVALHRRGELTAAFDTGSSAGAYFGNKDSGIGAQIGANVEAGMSAILVQDFVFPIFEDPETFLPLVLAFAMLEHSIFTMLGELMLGAIPDPMLYNTRTQFEIKNYAQATGGFEAGLRKPGANTKQNEVTTGTSGRDIGQRPWQSKVFGLQAAILAQARVEMGVGCEVTLDWNGVTDRSQGPKAANMSLFVEAEAGLTILHSLPIPFLPQLPVLGLGLGARVNFVATPGPDGEPDWSYKNTEVYAKQGDLDRYNGPAGEVSVEVTKKMLKSKEEFLAQLEGKQFTIRRRFNIAAGIGQTWLQRSNMGLRSLLPDKRDGAFTVEGFLTVVFVLTGEQAKVLVKRAIAAAGKTDLGELFSSLIRLLSGEIPEGFVDQLDAIASALSDYVTEVKLHGRAGVEQGAGAHVAAGGKFRGRVGGKLYLTVDKDLLPLLRPLDFREVVAILREEVGEALATGADIVRQRPVP